MDYSPEELAEAAELYPYSWILQNELKTSQGIPFEFDKRKFMKDFLNDLSPKQVLLKPPQVGASETIFMKACWMAFQKNKDIVFTLPTQSDVYDMVGGKFNRIIAQNPILGRWVHDHDTVEQKRIGDNVIYFRGTFTAKAAMMVSSGLNIHDEVDASDPAVITQYETRLEAQETEADKFRWYFSHPSLSGHGVDVYWQQSDKKEWHVICNNCSTEQILTWPDSVSIEKESYVCKNCSSELGDGARINGRWKPTGSGDFSGYHISQLMLYNKSAKDIIKAFNDPQKDKQYFYNYVLGLPYIGSEDKIEPSVVLRNCVDDMNPQKGIVIIGADTSHGINYVLMNKDGVFFYERAEEITASKDPYDVIRRHLDRYKRSIAIFDQGGDLIGVRKLQAKYPGRVYLVFYQKDRKTNELYRWGDGDEYGTVKVDRNRHLTLLVEQLRETGRITLNGTVEDWEPFAAQFGNIYREKVVVKETKDKDDRSLYGGEYIWKRNGHDDYVHALGYAVIGLMRFGEKGGVIRSPEDKTMFEQMKESPTIAPDRTIPAPDPKKIFIMEDTSYGNDE